MTDEDLVELEALAAAAEGTLGFHAGVWLIKARAAVPRMFAEIRRLRDELRFVRESLSQELHAVAMLRNERDCLRAGLEANITAGCKDPTTGAEIQTAAASEEGNE